MAQPYSAGLRFVEAGELDSRVLDLEDLDVTNRRGDDLGELDGFLVEADSGRPRYVVIDSGGWFHSKRFAVPVSEATYDHEHRTLSLDLDRTTIGRFPSFDDDRFDRWSEASWQHYDEGVAHAIMPVAIGERVDDARPGTTWWNSTAWTEYGHVAGRDDIRQDHQAEVMARERAAEVVAREDAPLANERYVRDVEHRSPARDAEYGARAQPGDILGIESGGETTNIGDTAEDEDRRREEAERDVRKLPAEERDRR
jgi:hypothetical protein